MHRPQRFGLYHFYYVKMAAIQLYLQSGKQRRLGLVGNDSHVVFGQNSLVKKVV
jgi:hypothetical protein